MSRLPASAALCAGRTGQRPGDAVCPLRSDCQRFVSFMEAGHAGLLAANRVSGHLCAPGGDEYYLPHGDYISAQGEHGDMPVDMEDAP